MELFKDGNDIHRCIVNYIRLSTTFRRSGFDILPLAVLGQLVGTLSFLPPNQKKYLGALNRANFSRTNERSSSSLGCEWPSLNSMNAPSSSPYFSSGTP